MYYSYKIFSMFKLLKYYEIYFDRLNYHALIFHGILPIKNNFFDTCNILIHLLYILPILT